MQPPSHTQGREADRAKLLAQLAARERELAESEARFRDVIERNADAIIVVDLEGVIQFANSRACQLFHLTDASLVGTFFGFPVVAGETTELEVPSNGTPARVVEMRVVESQWRGQPACIATLRDVTERKRAEEGARELIREQVARSAAEQTARRFRFLAESSSLLSASLEYRATMAQLVRLCVSEIADWAVVYCTDTDHQLRRYEVAHRNPEMEPLLHQFRDSPLIVSPDHPIETTLASARPIMVERLTPDDVVRLIPDPHSRALAQRLGLASFMMVPITARGRSLGALALVTTTLDRHFTDQDLALAENLATRAGLAIDNARLYEQASEANQTKTELLAVISHDLRTPLNSIIGYAQLLDMGIPEPLSDGSRERVQRIRQSAGHLLYLIDELLAFARVEGNHEDIRVAPHDACTIVREVAHLMEPLAHEKQLRLELGLPSEPAHVETDADKLRQVLVNLVGNAVKYTHSGTVRLTLSVEPDVFQLQVADTGAGIAPEHLPHIFEPFWQADRGQRVAGGGTGLGLAVVQRVVALLGGRISVASQAGGGSTFTVRLPVRVAPQ